MPTTRTPRIGGVLTEGTTKRVTEAVLETTTKRFAAALTETTTKRFSGAVGEVTTDRVSPNPADTAGFLLLEDGYRLMLEGDEVSGVHSRMLLEGDMRTITEHTRRVPAVV